MGDSIPFFTAKTAHFSLCKRLLAKKELKFENTPNDFLWENMYELAKKYYEHHGNLEMDYGFTTINGYEFNENGINLGYWLNNQKKKFDKHYNTQFGIINHPKDFEKFENNKSHYIRATWREQKRSILPKKLTKIKTSENKNEKIFEDFKKIYEQKKILWKKIDEENAKKKEKKEKDKEDVINYLFSVERKKSKK